MGSQLPQAHGLVLASRGEAVAIRRKGYGKNSAMMAGQDLGSRLGLAQVPQAHGPVVAGRGKAIAIGRKDYRANAVFMTG